MPTYIYKGLSKEHRTFMMNAYMASIKPQDPRGRRPVFHIDVKDSEELKEKKRARVKKWLADRQKEYEKTLDKLDASTTLTDSKGHNHVFEKNKPRRIDDHSSVVAKIDAMMSSKRDPFCQWEKQEEKKQEEKKG